MDIQKPNVKLCLECYTELIEVRLGEYQCPECLATYYESDFEGEGVNK
jgi:predicted RNA-binding Zn-ribbon protein involved in translation (DUF1610 family)